MLREQLDLVWDLAIATDCRTILAEFLERRLQMPDAEVYLPGIPTRERVGLFRA